ncbi:MAG: glutathione S-transferase family protein [Nostoc sp. DedVER02]|uniref:glutathione S-transferase family protein n=1 Tax=unclassified Nostoc TaxID=2593658 RepID=UPI002AD23566|nr:MULTISPECIES: glutathione S-transferase family protein [unclassified Nostoc]MDZ7987699.1 glutathione S-transferase family protein [Nostoc sp. DedVER02]MDZ8113130.1 glutathione S-transferase family protein [Nostoc sp. DedVER01b]
MKLYYAPASSYSQRVLIALYEKNIDFTPIQVNLFDPRSREQYMQINPFAKIPTLITDSGQAFFEACIIIEYLDEYSKNQPRLIPDDSNLALEVRFLERVLDVYINLGREALFADTQRPVEERGNKEVLKAKRLLETACNLLDARLQGRSWLAGEQFSLADCAAAPILAYLRMVYNYQHLPMLTDYVSRLEFRPSVAQVQHQGNEQMRQMLATLKYPLKLVVRQGNLAG